MKPKIFTPEEIKRLADFILLLSKIDRRNKELKKLRMKVVCQ
jgi:hypothetical protein